MREWLRDNLHRCSRWCRRVPHVLWLNRVRHTKPPLCVCHSLTHYLCLSLLISSSLCWSLYLRNDAVICFLFFFFIVCSLFDCYTSHCWKWNPICARFVYAGSAQCTKQMHICKCWFKTVFVLPILPNHRKSYSHWFFVFTSKMYWLQLVFRFYDVRRMHDNSTRNKILNSFTANSEVTIY